MDISSVLCCIMHVPPAFCENDVLIIYGGIIVFGRTLV